MQPEHYDFSNPVYLPITPECCQQLLESEGVAGLDALSDAELAAVMVIQHLAQSGDKGITAGGAEKILGKLLAWGVDPAGPGGTGLLSEARRLFDQRKLYFGLGLLKGMNLRLLDADEVKAREYLLADGGWDLGYKVRHHERHNPFNKRMITARRSERWLSSAQDRLVRTFRANLDEHLHVQGYAGVGKSHLLGALMECLQPGRTLALARTDGKLEALRRRLGGSAKIPGLSFQAFAQAVLAGPRGGPGKRFDKGSPRLATKSAVSEELSIFGFRGYSQVQTLDICLTALARYCDSWERTLSKDHLPIFRQPLSAVEERVLLEYSSRVWTWLDANPQWSGRTGFEALLVVKLASLAGCRVPSRFTHVIVDESQDLPPPLLQIIERGRQVLITLGDEYQKASGPVVRRQRQVRQNDVSYSVRSGRKVEELVNPLITLHSEKPRIPFEGARDADVSIETYPERFTPPEGCVVLTGSRWDSMKWAVELSRNNCGFGFLDKAAEDDMKRFMKSAVRRFRPDVYGAEGDDELHPWFAELTDWRQVSEASRFDESFLWLQGELEQGFTVADVTALDRMTGKRASSCLLLMAEEAGGWEFDQVLLTPGLLTTVPFKDVYEFDHRICAVYIAISRARHTLYLPYDLQEWIDYHGGNHRELHGY
ncbi:hypothetical protein G7009_03900 [Pseudomonas capeferrum]|uniref:hypothetical protein n=1 Tax=Pseudomonas capeferrum TaxID=1495066 RepID=UPI0015E35EEB|nr:hypothetical protein [Pseudomonas capeferrum]MBA1200925.1 hypothetical protein [Pseudomonas capeferrum]